MYICMYLILPGVHTIRRHWMIDVVQFTGLDYVSAPIFGRPDAVAARKVVVILAGSSGAKDRVRPLLEVIGRGIIGDPLHALRVQGLHSTNISWHIVFDTAPWS